MKFCRGISARIDERRRGGHAVRCARRGAGSAISGSPVELLHTVGPEESEVSMETFRAPKEFVDDPRYGDRRERQLGELAAAVIDEPIRSLILDFAALPYCFTLQSCYGHFLYRGQTDPGNVKPLPEGRRSEPVEYRIAYIALCIERSDEGAALHSDMRSVAMIDPEYVQFGCAEWFWRRHVNSYVLQVEPDRYRDRDAVVVPFHEARRIESIRNRFFSRIGELIDRRARG